MTQNYFESRYLSLIGHVQSGKTMEEINYCYASITNYRLPVVFIVRNIKADQLQLKKRFDEIKNLPPNVVLNVKMVHTLSIENAVKFMENLGVLIVLCNETKLRKTLEIVNAFNKPYNVCIDEVDFSIKFKDKLSILDCHLKTIKDRANHILGATATPFALFSSETSLCKIKKIKPNSNYRGIETLTVKFVDSCIIRSEPDFPLCDMDAMDNIYENFMEKERGVLLHTVVKDRKNHSKIQNYLKSMYPELTILTYNGDGIKVKTNHTFQLADRKNVNSYGQLINLYHLKENTHHFRNYSISEVLQILVDDIHYDHTHIVIIAGHLASRGISFVSTDYSLHLTDQYLYASKRTHGENLLQSLRILGCYKDNVPLTLWCSEQTWKSINVHNKIINNLVNGVNNNLNWMTKIKEVFINKPSSPLTRPRLCNYKINSVKNKFKLDLFYSNEEN